jgi:hypothetical protein
MLKDITLQSVRQAKDSHECDSGLSMTKMLDDGMRKE